MDKSNVLQAINGYLAVTSLWAAIIFWRYIQLNVSFGYKELRPAIALFVLFAGEVVLRAPQFVARALANAGYDVSQPNVTLSIGGLVVEAAILCMVRVFSPQKWGQWSWFLAFTTSSLVVLASFMWVYRD